MDKVTLKIDGKRVTISAGATVLQAAKSAGISIPHLCYRDDLKPTGACRICLVEVKGARTLLPSCSLAVSEGMVVQTNTPRVLEARKMVVELLLSDHPFACMTCEKSGSCKLEKYAYELRVRSSRFEGEKHQYPIDISNPFIGRDYNKCILCGRCVSACNEVQRWEAIDFIGRGFSTKIGTAFDRGLKESPCVFCGQCVDVCPVGALVELNKLGKGREWEYEEVDTVCSYCGVGCNLKLHVKDNEIIKVTSDRKSPVNKGKLCVKGRFGFDYVHHPDRLKYPMIRENGKLKRASWTKALDLVATKLSEIKEKDGPDSIAFLASAKCTNEENYLLQKFARGVIGTNNIDHCARL
jgi:predicted molibdopterin-dependent oxidoreductase YjgC